MPSVRSSEAPSFRTSTALAGPHGSHRGRESLSSTVSSIPRVRNEVPRRFSIRDVTEGDRPGEQGDGVRVGGVDIAEVGREVGDREKRPRRPRRERVRARV